MALTKQTFRVEFEGTGLVETVEAGSTLYDAAQRAGIYINSLCGGEGLCGKCRMIVRQGLVEMKPNSFLDETDIEKGYVSACLSEVKSDIRVTIPEESRMDEKPEYDGREAGGLFAAGNGGLPFSLVPLCMKRYLELPKPSLADSLSDLDRIVRELRSAPGAPDVRAGLEFIRTLPSVLREADFNITVTTVYRDEDAWELVSIEKGDTTGSNYGIACDVGTTTVMANLVDLNEGSICGSAAAYNSQIRYGEDVITRIIYAQEHGGGLAELNSLIITDINSLIDTLIGETGVRRDDIGCIVCTGNTIMIHIVLGIAPDYIRREPYIPVVGTPPTVPAKDMGININEPGRVGFLPGPGAYVGSDITAAVLASGMTESENVSLLIDVGTNGEIVLGSGDWLICCSASAGPAFEGAGTTCGMRATTGAIERVAISDDGSVELGIIGGGDIKPVGICGSGFIDLVSELFTAGFLDRTGRFRTGGHTSRIRKGENGYEFLLAGKDVPGVEKDIVATEDDIRTLIRTKGAIYTAAAAIIRHVGLGWDDIDRIYISGGFGNILDIRQSIIIGLLPDLDQAAFSCLGNGSIAGGRMCLSSVDAMKKAHSIAGKMTYFDLSTDPWFMSEYTSSLFLPHTDLDRFPTVRSIAMKR